MRYLIRPMFDRSILTVICFNVVFCLWGLECCFGERLIRWEGEERIIVKLKAAVSRSRMTDVVESVPGFLGSAGLYPVALPGNFDTTGLNRVHILRFNAGTGIQRIIKRLDATELFEYTEADELNYFQWRPDDPYFERQWGLSNHGEYGGIPGADVNAESGWDVWRGNRGAVTAVVDTGIDYDHPDLMNNMWFNSQEHYNGIDDDGNGFTDDIIGWDFENDDLNPMDDYGHGTHVAGIIGAEGNNWTGVCGIAPKCRLMAVKIGSVYGFWNTSAAGGIIYAVLNGADIINCSWGSYNDYELIRDVMDFAVSNDVLIVAAAGNDDTELKHYPAAYPDVISVGAVDDWMHKARWNTERASNFGRWVDVCAPGWSVFSTFWDDSYAEKGGTSMAAPFVSGLAVLLKTYRPLESSASLRSRLISAAFDINESNFDYRLKMGSGCIDVYAALTEKESPRLLVKEVWFNDALFGNHDAKLQAGEKAGLMVEIRNTWSCAADTKGFLSTEDTFCRIITDEIAIGDIYPEETAITDEPGFLMQLGEECPRNHLLSLWLELKQHETIIDSARLLVEVNSAVGPQKGWPQFVDDAVSSCPATCDLDGDGYLELVFGCESGEIYAFHYDGKPVSGFPAEVQAKIIGSPATADVDGDAREEIVIGDVGNKLYLFNGRGEILSGWPVENGGHGAPTSPAAGDLNGDGLLEIADAAWNGSVSVYSREGRLLKNWPFITDDGNNTSPAFGDLDYDGELEIVCASKDGRIYALDNNGELLPGWPFEANSGFIAAPALVDFDGDGDLEALAHSYDGELFLLHHEASASYLPLTATEASAVSSPAIADLDRDGEPEAVVVDSAGNIHIFNHRRIVRQFSVNAEARITASPVIADIDGDAQQDIIIAAGRNIYAFNVEGNVADGWPVRGNGLIVASPTIDDLDRDGDLEVIIVDLNRRISVIDTPGIPSENDWLTYQKNGSRTGLYRPLSGAPKILMAGVIPTLADDWIAAAWIADPDDDITGVCGKFGDSESVAFHPHNDDRLFTAPLPHDLPDVFSFTLTASDARKRSSSLWPYFTIHQQPIYNGILHDPAALCSSSDTRECPENLAIDPEEYPPWNIDGPVVLAAGFMLSNVMSETGGPFVVNAVILAEKQIMNVDLMMNGKSLDISMHDDGRSMDYSPNDAIFGFRFLIPRGIDLSGTWQFSIQAEDVSGRRGPPWPLFDKRTLGRLLD